jgi:hypothetical protein
MPSFLASFATLLATADALVNGTRQVRNEVRTLSNIKTRDPADRFLTVMNVGVRTDRTTSDHMYQLILHNV